MKVAHWMMLVRRMGLSKIHMSTARIVWASQMCTHCKERLQMSQAPEDNTESQSMTAADEQARYRKVMQNVPQPVVVVTTGIYNKETDIWLKRGITCSSFTSVALKPPIISFAIHMPSRIHDLLEKTKKFAVNVLAKNQVKYATHFASAAVEGTDQFEGIPHELNQEGVPVLRDTSAVLLCKSVSVNTVGDHSVWYGKVLHAYTNGAVLEPLLYYAKSFRSVGEELFMQAFEDTTLPFKDWDHVAHIRMAWNYIKENGKDKATPLIVQGIKNYNEQNKDQISRGYHETVTQFYIHMIADAVSRSDDTDSTFSDFIETNNLMDRQLLYEYYTDELINSDAAKLTFIVPNKKDLP
ncbi:hypothetical protein NP493_440g02008 [Ridgeia piscesae]|uniref:Flavin reductase like domain-containing protein n=1 Tax=Ridgeia piscesae TaxID=27915 RepID=A0AAD9KZD9_RIDPI|nr:hypothetical protein NP493_440g02008 [Ridgeia piscesae]